MPDPLCLQAISPKVLMVEEAGQVLEAHILASLVPSGKAHRRLDVAFLNKPPIVQHLIEIGDPQQLRPTLATYGESNCCSTSLSADGNNERFVDGPLCRWPHLQVRPLIDGTPRRQRCPHVSHQCPAAYAPADRRLSKVLHVLSFHVKRG